jgi:predicted  nucleic acid-binding Zn-ribbon protein
VPREHLKRLDEISKALDHLRQQLERERKRAEKFVKELEAERTGKHPKIGRKP